MTTYIYSGSGTINTFGCSMIERYIYAPYKWGERSVLYLRFKAVKGVLERVAVKKVLLNYRLGEFTPIYQDNLNSLYNEDDLISEFEARSLAQDYIDRERQKLVNNILSCGSNSI